ncbi:MAG: hypothetical protein WC322_01515 [Candidatus Paceibacterota bacterium]|jgi:hypothetical protein
MVISPEIKILRDELKMQRLAIRNAAKEAIEKLNAAKKEQVAKIRKSRTSCKNVKITCDKCGLIYKTGKKQTSNLTLACIDADCDGNVTITDIIHGGLRAR